MIFSETKLKGVFIVDIEKSEDARGFFARTSCRREFAGQGLNPDWAQNSVSFNHARGTLRGMHYQVQPHEETKLVRCTSGAIFDVVIDLRPESPTFGQWVGAELTASNHRMLYIPPMIAHGFQTLADNSEVFYQISEFYTPGAARGVRWNDPAFAIEWPETPTVMSSRDGTYPDFQGT